MRVSLIRRRPKWKSWSMGSQMFPNRYSADTVRLTQPAILAVRRRRMPLVKDQEGIPCCE